MKSMHHRSTPRSIISLSVLISTLVFISAATQMPTVHARPTQTYASPEKSNTQEQKREHQEQKQEQETLSPTLKQLNHQMHSALRASIAHQRQHLGLLIIFEDGKMKLIREDKEVAAFSIAPPIAYHQLKVFGHVFFASMIQLRRDELSQGELKAWIEDVIPNVERALKELEEMPFEAELIKSQRTLLTSLIALLKRATQARPTRSELEAFSRASLPHIWANAHRSAELHLTLIHKQAMRLMKLLTPQEQTTIRAHLYGGRGARRDNLVIQYLSWLFGENTGRESGRIVFSENIADHDRAMDMLARYTTERQLATMIFNDPERLDRDLLGDVTRALLKEYPNAQEVLKANALKRAE